jgi:hypothetical protein
MPRHGQYAWLRGVVVNVMLGAIAEQTPALSFEAADDLGSIRLDSAHRLVTDLRLYRRMSALLQAYALPAKTSLTAGSPVQRGGEAATWFLRVVTRDRGGGLRNAPA